MKDKLNNLFPIKINVREEVFHSNISSAVKRDLSWLKQLDLHDGKVIIVAGGPSINGCELQIKAMVWQGYKVVALNNTAKWLLERDIVPDFHILLDARDSCARFIIRNEKTKYLIASQCCPKVFDDAGETVLWHPNIEGIADFVGDKETVLIGCGTTVGLQAMAIVYTLGYKVIHLVGYDSSYLNGEGHGYKQIENDGEAIINVVFAGRDFICSPWMLHQVEEFKNVLRQLVDLDCLITIAGDGYLQTTIGTMLAQKKRCVVAFVWQGGSNETIKLSKIMVHYLRKNMPNAKIVHITTLDFPACDGVDEVFRVERKTDFVDWAYEALIKLMESPIMNGCDGLLQIATDVIIQDDVSNVFSNVFDVASCKYPFYTRTDGAYCGDVNFIKPSGVQFLKDVLNTYRAYPEIQDGWEGMQTAYLEVVKQSKHNFKELNYDAYCFTPESADEEVDNAYIVHYRGQRKKWMIDNHKS